MKTNRTKVCPYCGETIAYTAAACPECGSDEQTGWSQNTYLDGIDVGEEIDYKEIKENEFGTSKKQQLPTWQMVTGLLMILLFIVLLLKSYLG